jgi:GH15 family glucan-1,4-alpha-glucosidase
MRALVPTEAENEQQAPPSPYPPIVDYGTVADCRSAALIFRAGSIEWYCMPRFDNDNCFCCLLDWERGGHCALSPVDGRYTSSRGYLDGTMVLETRFVTDDAQVRGALIARRGYDAKQCVFVRAFDSDCLDAALLLSRIGYVDYRDLRMLRAVDAICRGLNREGLIARYLAAHGLPDGEGSFWQVDCLARQRRADEAWQYYRRALACANDVGLLSEEYDTGADAMLGHFPQALTHASQIMARLALGRA